MPTVTSSAGTRKLLAFILVTALVILAYVNYSKRVRLAADLKKLSVQMEQLKTGNDPQNVATARAIVDRVRKHFMVPENVDPTVATIVDVETLKTKNDFYKNAKNGDHLIVTATRAILYDPDKDIVIDVFPVQIQPQAAAASSSAGTK